MSLLLSIVWLTAFILLAFWLWWESSAHARESEREQGTVKLQAAAATREDPARRPAHRWQSFLIPVVGGAILAAAGGILNYNATNATTQAQLNNIEKHQQVQDTAIAANTAAMRDLLEKLPKEFKPRADIEHDEDLVRRTREEDEDRFARRQALLNDYRSPTRPAAK